MSQAAITDARQVLLSVKARVSWALKFLEQLINAPAAKKAFERLIAAGCDPEDLLFWLDFCCRGHFSRHAIDRRELGQNVGALAIQLLKNVQKLQKIEASKTKKEILKALQLAEFQGLSVRLQAYAECLMKEAEELQKSLSAREAPGLATGWLASRVEGSTDGTHYSEIARLMEAHYSMQGIHKDISSPAVAKQVKRFRQNHALAYSHMKNMASRQYGKRRGEYISGRRVPAQITENE